jgi:hypothetical protein
VDATDNRGGGCPDGPTDEACLDAEGESPRTPG